jgi:hypothetical protein
MDSRATHLIALLIAAAIVAIAAPIAQGGNRNHLASAAVPDPVRAAYNAAWQAYRGLPGGPPAHTLAEVQGRAYTAPRTSTESQVFSLGTALYDYQRMHAAQAGSKQGTAFPQLRVGTGFSFAAPAGWMRPTPPTANGSGDFDWSDWAIGIGTGLGLALLLGGGLLIGRQLRHRDIQTA